MIHNPLTKKSRKREITSLAEPKLETGYIVTRNGEETATVDGETPHLAPAWRFFKNLPEIQ
jgi:hypothetical protein